ncbi:MAG: response regulator [Pseudomonadota bacterium]
MAQRILVAEDEPVIAFDLCDTVEEAGYVVEGPHSGVSSAMDALAEGKPDLAILDVTLEDGAVFPLARKLMAENVPVIFHSGSLAREELEARFPQTPALTKPVPPAQLLGEVVGVLGNK